jgi:hypothetical protein
MPQSEDCLYLNVLTPAKKTTESLPVMVWLHGGGYTMGSGSGPIYNLPRLPRNGVVLVTINMRLGTMGLLAHSLLSKESTKVISGNYLFLDMIAALEWVQRNIAAFGGDSKNVTIFGESVNGVYSKPVNMGLEINSSNEENCPYIAPDESYIIFTRFTSTGENYYISYKNKSNMWHPPVKIHEELQGVSPKVSPDGKYFFFLGGGINWMPAKFKN